MQASTRRRIRRDLDDWFGTLARYAGLTVLVYAFAVDQLRTPALPGIGFGLMLVRNISSRAPEENDD